MAEQVEETALEEEGELEGLALLAAEKVLPAIEVKSNARATSSSTSHVSPLTTCVVMRQTAGLPRATCSACISQSTAVPTGLNILLISWLTTSCLQGEGEAIKLRNSQQ